MDAEQQQKFFEGWSGRLAIAKEKTDCLYGLLGLLWSSHGANPVVMQVHAEAIRKAWPLALEGIREVELYLQDLRQMCSQQNQQEPRLEPSEPKGGNPEAPPTDDPGLQEAMSQVPFPKFP